jgi:protein-L-isoaspartate(D-aspartate) O-methyltransferase
MAHVVGPEGHVLALEVDEALATAARGNLAPFKWVRVEHGNGTEPLEERFDAIFVHAGATHPLDAWLEALTSGGRLVLPITAAIPQMGPLSKGFMFLLTRRGDESFNARPLSLVAIYTATDIRDESLNSTIGSALMKGLPPRVSRLRRDPHESGPTCWLHTPTFCLGT